MMQFVSNTPELCVVTINEKLWAHAMEVCKALSYEKKTAKIVKSHCSKDNYPQRKTIPKYQMSNVPSVGTPIDWLKDSQKFDIYINEERMYELLFSSQQPKAKDFRRHCFNVLFPHVQQQLSDKSHAMEIEDLTDPIQAPEFTNEAHQQAIEEKDAVTALLNDDLKNREYEDVGLQVEIRAKDQEIAALQRRYVDYLSDADKKNGISIVTKNNDDAGYLYVSICGQHGYRRQKVRVSLTRNKGSTPFADGDTPNVIVTYNFWQEHRLIVVDTGRPRHFRLDTINQEQLLILNDT